MTNVDLLVEMNRKYPEFVSEERGAPLDPTRVPEQLRPYLPLAELWGVADDIDRERLIERAPDAAKDDLVAIVERIDGDLDDWLAGAEAESEQPSREYVAFSAMRMAADCI